MQYLYTFTNVLMKTDKYNHINTYAHGNTNYILIDESWLHKIIIELLQFLLTYKSVFKFQKSYIYINIYLKFTLWDYYLFF